jgi:hypothetical protein
MHAGNHAAILAATRPVSAATTHARRMHQFGVVEYALDKTG